MMIRSVAGCWGLQQLAAAQTGFEDDRFTTVQGSAHWG